jgi:oligopeptide/dipeptide ABC transporter ATP-binding protein
MSAPVLRVRDLVTTVRIGERDVRAVDGISFDIGRGRTLGLVGESGCGKSLTAMSIMRLLAEPRVRVAGGRILFEDQDLAALPDAALRKLRGARLAMIFQEPSTALNPVLTVGAQVGEPLRIHRGLGADAAFAEAVKLLEQVGIPAAAERARAYPHQLSGGMKQRAMIAMALACRPALLVADEPTTALDVTVQAQILSLLARLRQELGMALLLITHDLGVVAETCDEVAVMYAGRIVEQGPTAALLARPRHPYTVGLLGAMHALETGPGRAAGGERLREIPGTVPPLDRRPPGCAFADRCPRAEGKCRVLTPELGPATDAPADHSVRCWFPHA